MAWRFVRQPNGKLARFSDVVDNFTHYNLTKQEAILVAQEGRFPCTEAEALIKVQAGIHDIKPWTTTVRGFGLERWNDCLKTIEMSHGKEKLTEVLKEIDSDE